MKVKFNIFLLKYLLSVDLVNHFLAQNDITDARFDATILPRDNDKFFANISANDLDSYAMFGHEVIRIEITNSSDNTIIFYLFFRNGRISRPDLGTHKYAFTRPSSVEIGLMDSSGGYNSFYKRHYTDWITDPNLEFSTIDDRNQTIKDIEYDIINAVVTKYNSINNTTLSFKPVNNGHAVFPISAPSSQNANTITNSKCTVSQTNKTVTSIINKITK